jgi:hypothetical protein
MKIISLLSLVYYCLDGLMELIKGEWYFKEFNIIGIA